MELLPCSLPSTSLPPPSLRPTTSRATSLHSSSIKAISSSGFPRQRLGLLKNRSNHKLDLCRRIIRTGSQSRNLVVRSEFAEAGSPNASFSFEEFQLGAKIRGICFYAVTAFFAIPLFLVMLIVHPFVLLFDPHRRQAHHFIAKIWATLTVVPLCKVEFEGLENLPAPDVPAVYISNHQSFLDVYTLMMLGRNFKFISKTVIFLFPVIGWAMYLLGSIPLKRMDSRSQLVSFKRCIDLVKKGASVFFFAEGTRSKDGKLGPFKKGAFSVAAKTAVPIVPIALMGTGKLMPVGMETTLNSGSVKIVVHKPIEGNDPDILCEKARKVISDTLNFNG